jgi:hypothetical protein
MDKKTPITDQQFNDFCDITATTTLSKKKICLQLGISDHSIDKYIKIVGDAAERQYARSKEDQIEQYIDQIQDLQGECLQELRSIDDPKRCNSIQSAYREQIRHLEWIASKLKSKKYGDSTRVDMDGGLSITIKDCK